jgi:hypothetical protein
LGDIEFLEDVRACRPLELLEAYIIKLCKFLYSEGQSARHAESESEADEIAAGFELEHGKERTGGRANQEIRRAKIRSLLRQLEGQSSSALAAQLLEKASWDVERAAALARSDNVASAENGGADPKSPGANIPADIAPKANELVQKLYNTIRYEDAVWLLRKQSWDLEKAYEYSLHLQKTQTLADLLSIVKELVFIGENRLPAVLPKGNPDLETGMKKVTGAETVAAVQTPQISDAAEMERLPGRRVRDEKAFVLLCDLWDRVTDDAFRIQILDLALEIYGEHPLNFFSLQDAQLLPKVMRALDVLSPQLRERTLKVLEYVVTVADCGLPLSDLCLMNSCLDSIWGELHTNIPSYLECYYPHQ